MQPVNSPGVQGGAQAADGGTGPTEAQAAKMREAHAAQIRATQAAQQQAAQQQAHPAAQARPKAAAPQKLATAKVAGSGQLASFDEEPGHVPALELDLARVPAKGTKGAKVPANDVQPASGYGEHAAGAGGFGDEEAGPALELAEVGARVDTVKGGSRDVKASVAKEYEAMTALAGYDPKPTSLTGCVGYAIQVARRLMVLKKLRAKAEQDADGLEVDLNTALVEVGNGLMSRQTEPALAPLRSRVAAVLDAQSRVSDADLTMSKTREQNQQAVAELDAEAAEMRQNLQPFLNSEQAALQAYKKAEDDVKRATALQRRVEIELRALTDATSVQDPARADDLRSQLDERRSVAAGLTVEMEQKASLLAQARRELALKKGVLDSVEARKKRLLDESQKREADVEQKAKAAEGGHAAALRALAESAREQGLAQTTVPDKLAWVEEVEGVLADAHKVVARYDRALTFYDRPSVVKGWATVGGGVLVVVLLIVLLALQ